MSTVQKWIILVMISSGTLMINLDKGFIGVILPEIGHSLDVELSQLQWAATFFLISVSCLLPLAGYLSDRVGRKRFFVFGFGLYTVGSLMATISVTYNQLIMARMIQGIGTALYLSNIMATAVTVFEEKEQGKAMAFISVVVAGGSLIGPPLAGLITHLMGWRQVFFVCFFIAGLFTLLAALILKETKTPQFKGTTDLVGPGFLCLLIGSSLAVTTLKSINWISGVLVMVALSSLVVFYRTEKKSSHPFLPIQVLYNRSFVMSNAINLLANIVWFVINISVPYFLQVYLGYTPAITGIYLMSLPLGMLVGSPVGGVLTDRVGSRSTILHGSAMTAASLVGLAAAFNSDVSPTYLSISIFVFGIARGVLSTANQAHLMQSVPQDMASSTSGLVASLRNLGNSLGVTLTTIVLTSEVAKIPNLQGLITTSGLFKFHLLYLISVIIALVCLIMTFFLRANSFPATTGQPVDQD